MRIDSILSLDAKRTRSRNLSRPAFPATFFLLCLFYGNNIIRYRQRGRLANPTIRVGMDSAYAPYEWLDKKGNHGVTAVDYLRLVEEKLGIHFEIVKGKPWAELVEMAKEGEVDLLTRPCKHLNDSNILHFHALTAIPKR